MLWKSIFNAGADAVAAQHNFLSNVKINLVLSEKGLVRFARKSALRGDQRSYVLCKAGEGEDGRQCRQCPPFYFQLQFQITVRRTSLSMDSRRLLWRHGP